MILRFPSTPTATTLCAANWLAVQLRQPALFRVARGKAYANEDHVLAIPLPLVANSLAGTGTAWTSALPTRADSYLLTEPAEAGRGTFQ